MKWERGGKKSDSSMHSSILKKGSWKQKPKMEICWLIYATYIHSFSRQEKSVKKNSKCNKAWHLYIKSGICFAHRTSLMRKKPTNISSSEHWEGLANTSAVFKNQFCSMQLRPLPSAKLSFDSYAVRSTTCSITRRICNKTTEILLPWHYSQWLLLGQEC